MPTARDFETPSAVDADMGWRFETGDWKRADGNIQSLLFYSELVSLLLDNNIIPSRIDENRYNACVWHDYGCAEGDGPAIIKAFYPMMDVTGFDISEAAVATARLRWPTLKFKVGDVRAPVEEADIISSLHTLEHISDPLGAVRKLYDKAALAVVLVLPRITEEEEGGHIGAMRTAVFDAALRAAYDELYSTTFTTYRRFIGSDEFDILREHSHVWIIKSHK